MVLAMHKQQRHNQRDSGCCKGHSMGARNIICHPIVQGLPHGMPDIVGPRPHMHALHG